MLEKPRAIIDREITLIKLQQMFFLNSNHIVVEDILPK